MLVGAHVSIAGGLFKAVERGEQLGCSAIQIFSKNQMQWEAPTLTVAQIDKFISHLKNSSIHCVAIHDSYLINLASPDPDKHERSLHAFIHEICRAKKLKIPYLVFHPGSHMGRGESQGIQRIAESINEAITQSCDSHVTLLLENTAGQGSNIGYQFEQLANILCRVKKQDRIGLCFDTAHAFAAGYDIRSPESYDKTFQSFDSIIGLDKLKLFHVNDSKKKLNSRIDRHAQIGKGFIGELAFSLIMNDTRFASVPKILEIPGTSKDYINNLELLKSMVKIKGNRYNE